MLPHYHQGAECEKIVLEIMIANQPGDCRPGRFPGSGRKRGGDLYCAATRYEVKSSTTGRFGRVRWGIPIFCLLSSDTIYITMPFPSGGQVLSPHGDKIKVSGHFCPVVSNQVRQFPPLIIPHESCRRPQYVLPGNGWGVLIDGFFTSVETQKCPLLREEK